MKKILVLLLSVVLLSLVGCSLTSMLDNQHEVVDDIHKRAKQGDVVAECLLVFMYAQGRGVVKNDAQADVWFHKMVKQEVIEIQDVLKLTHLLEQGEHNGTGIPNSDVQTVAEFRKTTEQQGYAIPQYLLGTMYATGQGVAKDDAQAAIWFRKAAEQGDAKAQARLGVMYAVGQGVAQDKILAAIWLSKAAEQSYVQTQSDFHHLLKE